MKFPQTRIASFVLAFGLFFTISCSNLDDSQSSETTNLSRDSLQERIEQINNQISDDPSNVELQAEKADLLYRYAQTFPNPTDRKPLYTNLRDIAEGIIFQTESENKDVQNLLKKAWGNEQREGVRLLHISQDEETNDRYPLIRAHFKNAITLIPDSLSSYNLLATTYYQQGNINQAIETLKQAEEISKNSSPQIKEKLAYLYLESGDLYEAANRYQSLSAANPDNLHIKHGLINALILNKRHIEAIELLKELSDEYPSRYNYKESLATELYYLFQVKTDQYIQSGLKTEISKKDRKELLDLLNSIRTIFDSIQEDLPSNEENLYRVAAFYKNASQRLKNLPEQVEKVSSDDNDSEEMSFAELSKEYMEQALPLWERLAEINPDNMDYLHNLYQVYVALDMHENAQSIERSYNF